jgi:hypothetical protein
MANQPEHTAPKAGLLPIVLTVAGFFAFAVILWLFWAQQRPSPVAQGGRTPQERRELLEEKMARSQQELSTYGWVDRESGVVRLPVERAMELVLEDINGGQAPN